MQCLNRGLSIGGGVRLIFDNYYFVLFLRKTSCVTEKYTILLVSFYLFIF